jgi:hypothetical protein
MKPKVKLARASNKYCKKEFNDSVLFSITEAFDAGGLWAAKAIRRELSRSTLDPCTIEEINRMVDFALGTREKNK